MTLLAGHGTPTSSEVLSLSKSSSVASTTDTTATTTTTTTTGSSGSTTTSITTTSSTTSESSGAAPAGHDGAPAASPPEDVSTKGGEPAIATIVEPVVAVEVEPDRPEDEANVDATKNEAESEDGKTNLHDDHGAQHDEHPVTETEQDKLQTNKQIWAN